MAKEEKLTYLVCLNPTALFTISIIFYTVFRLFFSFHAYTGPKNTGF